jgi:CheY-like chemotaxis protein
LPTILIVDDSPENLSLLAELLLPFYKVRAVNSGERAIKAAYMDPQPHLILLDVMMPVMDGYEVIQRLKADPHTAHIPVIFVTAMDTEHDETYGIELGATDYISKPIKPIITLARVKVQLELKMARDLLVEQNAKLAQEVTLRLKEAQAAEKANRAKGEFLAHFSHELRTPLNAILGMAEIAKESDSISEIQECLTRLIRNGEVMLEHISGILDISKIESGEMDLDERPFDLPPLVEGVIEGLSLRASERQINISCYIDTSVPKRVKGDAHRVRQILINLIGNAIKFTDVGSIDMSVSIVEEQICFSVQDTGIGLTPEDLTHISRRFWRSERVRGYTGTGLGLNLTRSLTEQMRGTLKIESQFGVGSCFKVSLPLPAVEFAPPPPLPVPPPSIRLDLVWDGNHRASRHTLEARGFNVLPQFSSENPDILVTDTDTPGWLEQAERLRVQGTRIIGIAPVGRKTPLPGWLDVVLLRPFGAHRLLHIIETLCGHAPPPTAPVQLMARPYRILLAEDNIDNQRILQHYLRRSGYQVECVGDGLQAVEAARTYRYAMILMDLDMPVMDGLEAAAQIRAAEPEGQRVPIVALTAHALEGYRQRCLTAGMDDYVTKPIKLAHLAAITRQHVDTRPTVLVIDDAPDGLEVIRRFIEKTAEMSVCTAEDGFIALQMMRHRRIDAMIVDLEMPKMDGVTFIQQSIQAFPDLHVPIIALSGHPEGEILRQCEAAGIGARMSAYMVKPISRVALTSLMKRLILLPDRQPAQAV